MGVVVVDAKNPTWGQPINREFLNDVKAAKKAGKSIGDVAATWKIPAKYAGCAAPDPNRLKNNVRLAYADWEVRPSNYDGSCDLPR